MVTEQIEAHFDADEGYLRLDCVDEEFADIRDILVARTPAAHQLDPFIGGIRSIFVCRRSTSADAMPRRTGLGFRIVLILLVLALSLAIQVIGVVALTRWLWGFRS